MKNKIFKYLLKYKNQAVITSVLLPSIGLFLLVVAPVIVYASFGTWGDTSLIHACKDSRGVVFLVAPNDSCEEDETQVTWLKDVDAGTGLTVSREAEGATLSLQNGGVTTDKLASGSVTFSKLDSNAVNKFYTLVLDADVWTTSSASASFGTINIPVESTICVQSMWALQNNDSAKGMRAIMVKDSVPFPIVGDVIPFSSLGIAYATARNHCFENVPAGNHTFSVNIDQFPFESGKNISIREDSTMWITAMPTGN